MKKRYEEFDVLRGLAILGVILIHITAQVIDSTFNGGFSDGFAILLNQISRFAVPAFLFLSGFGLTFSGKLDDGYFNFLWKRLSKIILLYTLWSVIYYVITVKSFSILNFIKSFVLGSSYYHLYYVPLIIFFYIFYPLLFRIGKSNLGVVACLLITTLSQVADIFTDIDAFNRTLNVFNWVFYFVLGIWFSGKFSMLHEWIKQWKKLIIGLVIITIIGVFLESYLRINTVGKAMATTSMRPSIILLTILFIAFVLCVNWKDNVIKRTILRLSHMSYGIYLSHAIVLASFKKLYAYLDITANLVSYIITAIIFVVPLSFVVATVLDKLISNSGKYFNSKTTPTKM